VQAGESSTHVAGIAKPVRTRFFLYFEDEAPAREAGSVLDRRGFAVRVLPPDEHVEQWAIHAQKDMPGRIVSLRFRMTEKRLSRLASKFGGEYDGNEVEVAR
jgi:regulator of ribonuclease activity B